MGNWKELSAADSKGELFQDKPEPSIYKVYELNTSLIQKQIVSKGIKESFDFKLPVSEGEYEVFELTDSEVIHPDLQKKYPEIRSYQGKSKDSSKRVRLSFTPEGLHAMVMDSKRSIQFIEPSSQDQNTYISYKRSDLKNLANDFLCQTESLESVQQKAVLAKNFNDLRMRTFRLALACTGEYAQFHIDRAGAQNASDQQKKVLILAEMVLAISRINEIYENDLSIRFQIIPGIDQLIYLDGSTDPYTNNSGSTMLNENQTNIDNVIGTTNYDIGHVFSTGGGGLASLASACTSSKAKGVTGSSNPVGDRYYFDFVAHEFGHQLGANHTFNGTAINCGGDTRNATTSVEPGSGSTLMAYAGLCAPQNVQGNSDLYFHTISIKEIWNNVSAGRSTCAAFTNLTQNRNVPLANAGSDFTIPKSTPYVLRGSGSDADNDPISYCWEQIDAGATTVPPSSTATSGALYRSVNPKESPNRYMPDLKTVVSGNLSTTWEVTPSVARNLNFTLTVRDNNEEGGQSASDDMKVTISDAAGPFVVTSQNEENLFWEKNSSQIIKWNVAGTTGSNINAANVNIFLSTDGGLTFSEPLKLNTPNDGEESIQVPNTGYPVCYIMVAAANNIFYSVNKKAFSIGTFVEDCNSFVSTDVPKKIPDNNLTGVISQLNVPNSLIIDRLEVSVNIEHAFVNDLQLDLISPSGKSIALLRNQCFGPEYNNLGATFTNDGSEIICSLTLPSIEGRIKPQDDLQVFNGDDAFGIWRLRVIDNAVDDIGSIIGWNLNICTNEEVLSNNEFELENFNIYPNPAENYFTITFSSDQISDVSIIIYDMLGREIIQKRYNTQEILFREKILIPGVGKGIYFVKVSRGNQNSTRKLIIK
ncbi:zinc-dependent metalloprotease family protein [Namhaeicola litoreus]|uniref:Zinc-dependent metalloprotease family protein n=1 Tax=Namhaeicola litoreus TaxID=1052145 RepID=A0ABW3XZY9_9FLAO